MKGIQFGLHGMRKEHVFLKIPAVKSESNTRRRCSAFKKQKY